MSKNVASVLTVLLLLCLGVVRAEDRTTPATRPAETAAAEKTHGKLPTPAEIIERMKQRQQEKALLAKVAHIDLDSTIAEQSGSFSLFGGMSGESVLDVLQRLDNARDDKEVRAVLITLGPATSMNIAQAVEIHHKLLELRRAGKKTFIYADGYDTIGYILASACTNIVMLPGGDIMIPGIRFETMFYKGVLDKVGVKADFVQIGEYKGADEAMTRTEPSDELRAEMNKLVNAMFDELVTLVSGARGVSKSQVRQLIDEMALTGNVALNRGFVDHLTDQDGLRELIKNELNDDIDLLADYGKPQRREIDFSNPFALLATLNKKPEASNKPAIAIIYAEGTIVDGSGDGGLFMEGGVGSEVMRKTFREALRDENVKAIVLRIDSPGGSALASEVMWQAARRLAKEKPLIVSIGSMAASGGYYLASAGEVIYADPIGIVGSIGVVGGKYVTRDLYDKLGLTTEAFSQGRHSGLFSSDREWDERERRLVRTWMQQTYDQFTQRVMTTRSGKIRDIDAVARGRIFTARQGKELGMVDELGGIDAAILHAAARAELKPGDYEIRILPAPRTLADMLGFGSAGFTGAAVHIRADSILHVLPDSARKMIGQHVRMARLLESRPVILMTPYVLRLK